MKTILTSLLLFLAITSNADEPTQPAIYRYVGKDKDLKKVELLIFKNAERELTGFLTIDATKDTLTSVRQKGTDFSFRSKEGWRAEGKDLTEEDIKVKMYKNDEKYRVKLQKAEPDYDWEMSGFYTYRTGPFTDNTSLIIHQLEDDKIYFTLHYQTKNMVIKKKFVDEWGHAKKVGPSEYRFRSNFEACYGTKGCDFTFKKDDNGKIIVINNSDCQECLYGLTKGDKIYFENPKD